MPARTPTRPPSRRRFALACTAGALAGVGVVLLIVALTGVGPGTRHYSDDFFDAQARAWLGGHWDVPADVVGIEGYATDHGMQMYFGVTPALARLPLLVVTDRLDGHLTLPSLLVALVVLAVATARLLWRARLAVAADGERRHGRWFPDVLAGLLLFLVTGASTATFLAAQPTVYTEAVLWGVALAVAAADVLVRFLDRPTLGRGLGAAGLAALALNARVSTGAGALLAVGAVAVLVVVRPGATGGVVARARTRVGLATDAAVPARVGLAMGGVLAVGVVVLCGANLARFGSPLSIPYARQVPYRTQPERLAELERTGGLFSPKYAVGDVLTYLRPDGVQLEPAPAVTFLDTADAARYLDAPPNLLEPTGSVPAAMPGLLVLAVVGAVVLVGRPTRGPTAPFRLPVAGAVGGTTFVFLFASIAHRYTGDLLPVLVLLGALGTARLGRATAAGARAAAVVGLALAAVWGAWVQVGLGMTIAVRSSLHNRAALERWVGTLTDLERRVDGDAAIPRVDAPPAADGWWTRIADRDCNRVYVAYDGGWYAIARRPGTGAFHLRVVPPAADAVPRTLVTADDGRTRVGVRTDAAGTVLVASTDGGATWEAGTSRRGRRADGADAPQVLPIEADGRIDLLVDVDPFTHTVSGSGADPDSFLVLRRPVPDGGRGARLAPDPGLDVTTVDDGPTRCEEWTRPAS